MKAFLVLVRATRLLALAAFFLLSAPTTELHAQAKLSIQGILKKIDGTALADGIYGLKFRIYADSIGGTALWTETQNIELTSGVYSAVLGAVTPLTVPFDQPYYVGVSLGSATEMLPRIALTSAPYAISLIGQNNIFPSTGTVKADEEIIAGKLAVGQNALSATHTVEVSGGLLAKGGAPGANGANNAGYAFGAGGDNDSGLFSTNGSTVSLYANSAERLQANDNGVQVTGNAAVSGNVALAANGRVVYGALDDWRLVYRNDFESGNEGWSAYDAILSAAQTATENPAITVPFNAGKVLKPALLNANQDVMKRQYDLNGVPHTHIRVRFTFHAIDTWDGDADRGWAGISTSATIMPQLGWFAFLRQENLYGQVHSYFGLPNESDFSKDVEMTFKNSDPMFWLFIGGNMNGAQDEDYAIDNVEIWVR